MSAGSDKVLFEGMFNCSVPRESGFLLSCFVSQLLNIPIIPARKRIRVQLPISVH